MDSGVAQYILFMAGAMICFGASYPGEIRRPVRILIAGVGVIHMMPGLVRIWSAALL